MIKKKYPQNIKYLALISVFTLSLLYFPHSANYDYQVYGQTSQEIENQIKQKQEELTKLNNKYKQIEGQHKTLTEGLNTTIQTIESMNIQLQLFDLEIEKLTVKLKKIEIEKQVLEIKRQELELLIHTNSISAYKHWRSTRTNNMVFLSNNTIDPKKYEKYSDTFSNIVRLDANKAAIELSNIYIQLDKNDSDLQILFSQKAEIQVKRDEMQRIANELANQNNALRGESLSLNKNIEKLQADITFLSEEQKKAMDRERQILENSNPTNNTPISQNAGDFYFTGTGRDIYQGHGVGMGQWGAHGMANNGFNYEQILKFYYSGVEISQFDSNINISVVGIGQVNIEDYVAGQGEVPAKACGTTEQVTTNPSKYVVDNPNTSWDCWPEEAIKAQAVAFRTYALNYVVRNGSICATAACQVYYQNKNSSWAAQETMGQVLTYGGSIIEALYSADNNQGFGTANNDTVFNNFSGNGTPYPYLRAVNDNQYSTRTYYTDWRYSTRRYKLSDIMTMLSYIAYADNPTIDQQDGFVRSNTKLLISSHTSITNMSFEVDPSNRVKKIHIQFDGATTKSISGYWFKYIWNLWSYYTSQKDYIYSLTFIARYD
jgi:SpoIID/LytB domain protein